MYSGDTLTAQTDHENSPLNAAQQAAECAAVVAAEPHLVGITGWTRQPSAVEKGRDKQSESSMEHVYRVCIGLVVAVHDVVGFDDDDDKRPLERGCAREGVVWIRSCAVPPGFDIPALLCQGQDF